MSQNIEKALARMKCPYNLQSQQIIFLDCIALYPVVQWLVKKVMEVRHETSDLLRVFSESQFLKDHKIRTTEQEEARAKGGNYLQSSRKRYQTIKQYHIKRGSDRLRYAEPIQEHKLQYDQTKEELLELTEEASQKLQGQYQHKRALQRYANFKEQQMQKVEALMPAFTETQQKAQTLKTEYEEKVALNHKIATKIKQMLGQETEENREDLKMLRTLVTLNENLKLQIANFKQNCKEQLALWQHKINLAREGKTETGDVENIQTRFETIEKAYEKDVNKMKAIQSLLSTKKRAIALVRLKMDEIPSRRELQQYTKQFLELSEQMALRFTETRQYVNTYNSLLDQHKFLDSEVKILNFLQENYPSTIKNKTGKQKIVEYMLSVSDSVLKNLDKAQELYNAEIIKARELDEQYSSLVEKERLYYRAAKDFQDVCPFIYV